VSAIFDNVLKNTCYVKLFDKCTETVEHPSEIYVVREGYYHTVDSLVYELRMMLILLGISLEMEWTEWYCKTTATTMYISAER